MTRDAKVGLWLTGGRGSVATTTIVGAAAIAGGIAEPTGMVTAQPPLSHAPLPPLDAFVIGGHDLVSTPLQKRAETLAAAGVFPRDLAAAVVDSLVAADAEIAVLPAADDAPAPQQLIERIRADLTAFRSRHDVESIVVINVASSEPAPTWDSAPADRQSLEATVRAGWSHTPVSVVSALAAIGGRLRLRRLHAGRRCHGARHRASSDGAGRSDRRPRRQDRAKPS